MSRHLSHLEFRVGALVMVDALGFRGIWRRHKEAEVISKLETLAADSVAEATQLQSDARRSGDNLLEFVRPVFLSDTVILGVATKTLPQATQGLTETGWSDIIQLDEPALAGAAVSFAAELVGGLMRKALEGSIPLAFRGAISFGRFGMTDRFVIGAAVDEAAEWMNCANGALVMLAPSAATYPQAEVPSTACNLVRYAVPLRGSTSAHSTAHRTAGRDCRLHLRPGRAGDQRNVIADIQAATQPESADDRRRCYLAISNLINL